MLGLNKHPRGFNTHQNIDVDGIVERFEVRAQHNHAKLDWNGKKTEQTETENLQEKQKDKLNTVKWIKKSR